MHDPDERFRRLRPPASGDLFAHFGVELEPPTSGPTTTAALARACERCGWWIAHGEHACDMCGAAVRILEAAR